MRLLKFLAIIVSMMIAAFLVALTYKPESEAWQAFLAITKVLKWILVPGGICLLPTIIRRFTHSTLTPATLRMVRQCQVLMAFLFLAIEGSRYMGGLW